MEKYHDAYVEIILVNGNILTGNIYNKEASDQLTLKNGKSLLLLLFIFHLVKSIYNTFFF